MAADNTPDGALAPSQYCRCRNRGTGRYTDWSGGKGPRTVLCDHTPVRGPGVTVRQAG